jgi:NitT/TauT family transport system permease protein
MKRALDIVLLVLAGLAIWEAMHLAAPFALTSPAGTAAKTWQMLASTTFWPHAAETAKAFLYALLLAVVGGLAMGFALGLNRTSAEVAEPILVSVYSLPKVTLYPLILLIFGLGVTAKVTFGVIHGVIPIILFTLNAVKNINPVLLRTARVMRLTAWQTVSTVLAPAVMPELVTGVRVGFSLTMLGVLIGEMFASQRGLGFLIINGISLHNVRMTTAVILIVVTFAIVANGLLLWVDKRMYRGATGV